MLGLRVGPKWEARQVLRVKVELPEILGAFIMYFCRDAGRPEFRFSGIFLR